MLFIIDAAYIDITDVLIIFYGTRTVPYLYIYKSSGYVDINLKAYQLYWCVIMELFWFLL